MTAEGQKRGGKRSAGPSRRAHRLGVRRKLGEEVVGISPERVDSLLGEPTEWSLPVGLVAGGLGTVVGLAGLAWRASATASMHVTLGLPVVSSQPCVLMLGLLLLSACAAATVGRRALARAVAR